jgi:hypothetical protein
MQINYNEPDTAPCPHCEEDILVSFAIDRNTGILSSNIDIEAVLSKPSEDSK